ncbi:MAG: hypothetical protein ACFE89_09055 [Candidatus Hodarchaeota archaeon]
MTNQKLRKWYQRREVYLIAGIAIGITLMMMPAITHLALGPTSPFLEDNREWFVSGETIASPIDAATELLWIALPAIFFVVALYWIVGRRRRWAGYDSAVKWSRR